VVLEPVPRQKPAHSEAAQEGSKYQFKVSAETVPRLFFDFIHVLHDAFSSRAALLKSPRLDTMNFHDDHMSSSRQSCEK
jgi:hypothetical protein